MLPVSVLWKQSVSLSHSLVDLGTHSVVRELSSEKAYASIAVIELNDKSLMKMKMKMQAVMHFELTATRAASWMKKRTLLWSECSCSPALWS